MQCNVDTKNYRSNYSYLLHVDNETFMRIILTSAGRMHGGTLLLQEWVLLVRVLVIFVALLIEHRVVLIPLRQIGLLLVCEQVVFAAFPPLLNWCFHWSRGGGGGGGGGGGISCCLWGLLLLLILRIHFGAPSQVCLYSAWVLIFES